MKNRDRVALLVDWEEGVDLPSVIGPFGDVREAAKWAKQNIPNGTWEYRVIAYPYLRSGRSSVV